MSDFSLLGYGNCVSNHHHLFGQEIPFASIFTSGFEQIESLGQLCPICSDNGTTNSLCDVTSAGFGQCIGQALTHRIIVKV